MNYRTAESISAHAQIRCRCSSLGKWSFLSRLERSRPLML